MNALAASHRRTFKVNIGVIKLTAKEIVAKRCDTFDVF